MIQPQDLLLFEVVSFKGNISKNPYLRRDKDLRYVIRASGVLKTKPGAKAELGAVSVITDWPLSSLLTLPRW